jgi:hypothetical protein
LTKTTPLTEITRPSGRFKSLFTLLHFVSIRTAHSEYCAQCLISGFRREGDENRAVVGYYAASSGNFLSTFWGNLSIPTFRWQKFKRVQFLNPEDGIDRLSRNVGKKLSLPAA